MAESAFAIEVKQGIYTRRRRLVYGQMVLVILGIVALPQALHLQQASIQSIDPWL